MLVDIDPPDAPWISGSARLGRDQALVRGAGVRAESASESVTSAASGFTAVRVHPGPYFLSGVRKSRFVAKGNLAGLRVTGQTAESPNGAPYRIESDIKKPNFRSVAELPKIQYLKFDARLQKNPALYMAK